MAKKVDIQPHYRGVRDSPIWEQCFNPPQLQRMSEREEGNVGQTSLLGAR